MAYIKSTKDIDDLNFPLYLSDDREYNSYAYELKVTKEGKKFHISGVEFSHKDSGLKQIVNIIDRNITKNELKSSINAAYSNGKLDKLDKEYRRNRIKRIIYARKAVIKYNDDIGRR